MNFPENLLYTEDHEWVRIEGNIAFIGVTDFAQSELGDIVYVEVEKLEQTVEANEIFGTIEAVKTVSDLFMPISGEVTELNPKLQDEPELVNSDPYGEGWIIKVKITGDISGLLTAEKYAKTLGE